MIKSILYVIFDLSQGLFGLLTKCLYKGHLEIKLRIKKSILMDVAFMEKQFLERETLELRERKRNYTIDLQCSWVFLVCSCLFLLLVRSWSSYGRNLGSHSPVALGRWIAEKARRSESLEESFLACRFDSEVRNLSPLVDN